MVQVILIKKGNQFGTRTIKRHDVIQMTNVDDTKLFSLPPDKRR